MRGKKKKERVVEAKYCIHWYTLDGVIGEIEVNASKLEKWRKELEKEGCIIHNVQQVVKK